MVLPNLLIVTPPTINGSSNSITANTGQYITVTYDVVNLDAYSPTYGTHVPASISGIYLSIDDIITTSDTLIGTDAVPGIPPGYVVKYNSVTLQIPSYLSGGMYYIGVVADFGNLISETRETDNASPGLAITISAPLPDLDVIAAPLIGTVTIVAGDSTWLSFEVDNLSGATAGPSAAGIYLSSDNLITTADTLLAIQGIISIPAGYYTTVSGEITIPTNTAPGSYYVGAIADSTGWIEEKDETNNGSPGVQIVVVANPFTDDADSVELSHSNLTWYSRGGDDSVFGTSGDDTINGGAGNDTLNGAAGTDTLVGDGGDDSLSGGLGNDILVGGVGNDTLEGGSGGDALAGGDGIDIATFANGGFVQIFLTAPSFNGGDAAGDSFTSIEGYSLSAAGDNFFGDNGGNIVSSGGGGDIVFTYDGDDTIDAGSGDDYVVSGEGNDTIAGGEGADILAGLGGDDVINGDDNSIGTVDQLYGYDGNDTLNGDGGDDLLFGMNGNDTLNGGEGSDYLYGESGDDVLDGGAAYDLLQGQDGDDRLFGGDDGPETVNGLIGGNGNDTLVGGTGIDYLYGGDGAVDDGNDVFEVHLDGYVDVIVDFQAGAGIELGHGDVLDLVGSSYSSFEQLQSANGIVDAGAYTCIFYDINNSTNVVYLLNVHAADLSADDFQFS